MCSKFSGATAFLQLNIYCEKQFLHTCFTMKEWPYGRSIPENNLVFRIPANRMIRFNVIYVEILLTILDTVGVKSYYIFLKKLTFLQIFETKPI